MKALESLRKSHLHLRLVKSDLLDGSRARAPNRRVRESTERNNICFKCMYNVHFVKMIVNGVEVYASQGILIYCNIHSPGVGGGHSGARGNNSRLHGIGLWCAI